MNIGIGTFLKNGVTKESIESALRRIVAAIMAGFQVEHREDGTHSDVTCDTLTVAAVETDGNVTGSLVPTADGQDLGAVVDLSASNVADRPWRHLRLSGDINWGAFSTGAQALAPTLTRSSNSLALNTNTTGTLSLTGNNGINSTTLTVNGLTGVLSNKNFDATTSVTAGTFVRGETVRVTDGITAPGAQSGAATIYVDSADGSLKVVFASGTVKTLATDP